MTATALGLGASVAAVLWLGQNDSAFVRLPVYLIALAFGGLAALHVLTLLYRALTRLEELVTDAGGGCRCGGSARRRRRRRKV